MDHRGGARRDRRSRARPADDRLRHAPQHVRGVGGAHPPTGQLPCRPGVGAHRERDDLANWECGQDRVALIMHNDLYPDMVIGSLKARTVPVNVNYNYAPREVAELLEYLRPRAVIYHRSFGPKLADVLAPRHRRRVDLGRRRRFRTAAAGRHQLGRRSGSGRYGSRHRAVARRCDDGVHRRNHGASQGRDVAAERHLRGVDERRRPRVRRRDSRQGRRTTPGRPGSPCRR